MNMGKLTKDQKEEIVRQYNLVSSKELKVREHQKERYSLRDEYHRDYTRILYSSSFRRLQGKMQILGIENTAYFRNRLTHSLEVSQIAHSIAAGIGQECGIYKDDLFLIDAAALAHDIGHPAFGHKGERVLDDISKKICKRFEGNAQNFRVLRTLEKKEPQIKGLNLTYRTLLAINKYIVKENGDAKKFMFADDFDVLMEARYKAGLEKRRTLDVQIIELADDIAYAVHDLEDALAFGYFSIDELLYEVRKVKKDLYEQLLIYVTDAREYAMKAESYKTIQEYSQVFRKRLTSKLTYDFVNDVTLSEVTDGKAIKEHGTEAGQMELQLNDLKDLCKTLSDSIFNCVSRFSNVMTYEARGEIVLKSLYLMFSDENINKDGKLMPPDYRPQDGYCLKKGAIDYLAGMMDSFAISKYEELYGEKFNEIVITDIPEI